MQQMDKYAKISNDCMPQNLGTSLMFQLTKGLIYTQLHLQVGLQPTELW